MLVLGVRALLDRGLGLPASFLWGRLVLRVFCESERERENERVRERERMRE